MKTDLPDNSLVEQTLDLISEMGATQTRPGFDDAMYRQIEAGRHNPPAKGVQVWQIAASLLLLAGINLYVWVFSARQSQPEHFQGSQALAQELHLTPVHSDIYQF